MDVSIAVPSPRHDAAASATASSFSLPSPPAPASTPSSLSCDTGHPQQQQQQQQTTSTTEPAASAAKATATTLVHARLDAREVKAAATTSASDSGQEMDDDDMDDEDEVEDSHCSTSSASRLPLLMPALASVVRPTDAEPFDGKIVYNPDGSAYIIEENQGDDDLLDHCADVLPKLEGAIVDERRDHGRRGMPVVDLHDVPSLPHGIASALYVSRVHGERADADADLNDAPVMHSFRVYSARDSPPPPRSSDDVANVKPILMCFVCKLSFGLASSLTAHATGEHGLRLDDEEKRILNSRNPSAIVQLIGRNKEAVISFLEPQARQQQQLGRQPRTREN